MITLLTGIPGSGKSYMAVHHVSKLQDQSKVLHNIEGFKLGISLDQFSLDNNISKTDVFRKSWHEKNNCLHGWTIIIDEAAELFPKTLRDTDIIGFFDYHRHYGIDIFLITQDIKKVTPDITCLSETHYRAASGAANPIPGFLIYQQMVGGEAVSRKFIRKKKEVFDLYKSTNDHSSSTLNIGKIYLIVALIAALGAAYALKKWFASFSPQPVEYASVIQSPVKPLEKTTPQNVTRSKPVQTLLGGTPYPVSVIKDHTGEHIIFAGNFYRKDLFPFKLAKTRTGLVALLPPDALSFALKYEENLEGKIKATSSGSGTEPPAVPVANGSERKARESEGVTAGL